MKAVDESKEAVAFVMMAAHELERQGVPRDQAIQRGVELWMRSLERMQKKCQVDNELRSRGKPTLHVGLFEAARLKETKK